MRFNRSLFLIPALILAAQSAAGVQTPSMAAISTPPPQSSYRVGTLAVTRYGTHGRPLILIPGLSGGTWVWGGTIAHFMGEHVVYAVTLAGFDGVPAPQKKTDLIGQADDSLLTLIREHHVERPVLVGHGLGGTLAMLFATRHSALLAGVVALDGLPVFPLMNVSQRESAARQLRSAAKHLTHAEFKARQMRYMKRVGVIDQELAKHCAELSALSDPATVSEYTAEDFEWDLRPALSGITVPLLEISPYYKPDFKRYAELNHRSLTTAEQKADYYRALLENAPHARVITLQGARHFAMLDQPDRFYALLKGLLNARPSVKGH